RKEGQRIRVASVNEGSRGNQDHGAWLGHGVLLPYGGSAHRSYTRQRRTLLSCPCGVEAIAWPDYGQLMSCAWTLPPASRFEFAYPAVKIENVSRPAPGSPPSVAVTVKTNPGVP